MRTAMQIGQRVAYYRARRSMSAQQLADRCAELGMPAVSRIVITKLENGRREVVSTAELQVLAMALDVPPVLLLFPLGHAAEVEILPGHEADPWDAILWFLGSGVIPAGPRARIGGDSPVALWSEHRRCEGLIPMLEQYRREAVMPGDKTLLEAHESHLATTVMALRRVRDVMESEGLTPPVLAPETARILAEAAFDGSR